MAQGKNIAKGKKTVKNQQKVDSKENALVSKSEKPIGKITLRILLLGFVVLTAILYSDHKGFFNPNQANDHTLRKWDSFYEFTRRNNVDVLLLGNSHLYTGINPKNLSTTLGANAFILASPGTQISDSYFSLKEALKSCDPSLVVIETYGIKAFNQYTLTKGGLSDQFKSFSARRNLMTKIASTPLLFSSENFVHAWSNTIRNHEFIFTNQQQLKDNKELLKKKKKKEKEKLYLGRYVRFTTGIEDSIMNKYLNEGPRVDGNKYEYNKFTEKYTSKITKLCEARGIDYIFLTLPMYDKHIKDYSVWKDKIAEILNKYPVPWLNMQDPYLHETFTPMCFENTYNTNQHMTYQGSLIATYMLANYIIKDTDIILPDRKKEQQWHNLFYGDEGYFENNSPHPSDKRYKVISRSKIFRDFTLEEVLAMTTPDGNTTIITAKVKRSDLGERNLNHTRLNLALKYTENGEDKIATIPLQYDILHTPLENAIYTLRFGSAGIEILDIVDGRVE